MNIQSHVRIYNTYHSDISIVINVLIVKTNDSQYLLNIPPPF